MLAAVRQSFPHIVKLEYILVQNGAEPSSEEDFAIPRQITINDLAGRPASGFNPRFTFDQFVIGNCNHLAYASAMALAGGGQFHNQSVYILSETGLGKSHLSHAVGNYLFQTAPEVRVQYVTAEQFTNEMIFSLKNEKIESFKNKFRNGCDILLFEKIEFLSGKEKVQSEFMYTLDELMDRGKRVLCTGNALPKDIPKLNSELQSRLSGVLVAPMNRPDFETRRQIISRKAKFEGLRLPEEVVDYLAERATGDVRQLESCLSGIIVKSNILGMALSLDLAREVTENVLDRLRNISIDDIQQVVCSAFQLSVEDLRSVKRHKQVSLARKIGMYLSRLYTSESLESIGKSFRRSHSSVVYAIKELTRELEDRNSKVKRQVEYVSRRLDTNCLS